ncbi:MAG: hypothetical protein ACO3F2_01505 [Roseiflexaceae bacterium]
MPAHEWYRWGQIARNDGQAVYVGGALGGEAIGYAYYDAIRLITRAPLWSQARWWAIWQMNTGQYEYLRTLEVDHYIDNGRVHLLLDDVEDGVDSVYQ